MDHVFFNWSSSRYLWAWFLSEDRQLCLLATWWEGSPQLRTFADK